MENKQKKFNITLFMIKAQRIAGWIMAITMIIYAVSGYGMTKGIIDQDLARSIHFRWLGAIAIIAFCVHIGWAAHLTLRRKGWWNKISKTILILLFLGLISFFSYLHFFYQSPNIAIYPNAIQNSTVFTTETLKQYTGLNGQPAYVAVDGIVYDMSPVFKNGFHEGHQAGQDLTNAFHQEHPNNFLKKLTIVGIYQ